MPWSLAHLNALLRVLRTPLQRFLVQIGSAYCYSLGYIHCSCHLGCIGCHSHFVGIVGSRLGHIESSPLLHRTDCTEGSHPADHTEGKKIGRNMPDLAGMIVLWVGRRLRLV